MGEESQPGIAVSAVGQHCQCARAHARLKAVQEGHLLPLGPSTLAHRHFCGWDGSCWATQDMWTNKECTPLLPGHRSEVCTVGEKQMCGAERAVNQNSPHVVVT